MREVIGSKNVRLIECVNPRRDKWCIRWNVIETEDGNATYMEEVFDHKPSLDEVKAVITGWQNSVIDQKILTGFKWRDMAVWLSSENQFNYKVAYDLAVQTGGRTLPVKFKFGTDFEPKYFTFENLGDLADFYQSSVKYVIDVLNAGWDNKDALNLALYEV